MEEGFLKASVRRLRHIGPLADFVLAPLTLCAAIWFRVARYWGVKNLRLTRQIFLKVGVFPIVDHYYEPLFDHRRIHNGIIRTDQLDFRPHAALALMTEFRYASELMRLPMHGSSSKYHYENGSFGSGDAELYYSMIRKLKPKRIIEVGSGFSSLIALEAISVNRAEGAGCELTCIEPYEMPQLEGLDMRLIRNRVETFDPHFFQCLNAGDMLFIDSSHIIRPGGDVSYLILRILPSLNAGVLIHFHDIFLPEDYPIEWLRDEYRMWNEQYLLEALLRGSKEFEVVFALNYMKNSYPEQVARVFPVLGMNPAVRPGSFWIRKVVAGESAGGGQIPASPH